MSTVHTTWDCQPLPQPDHQRLLRILFDDLSCADSGEVTTGALDVTRRAESRRDGGVPSSSPRRGSVCGGDSA
jgi:hypothetical protein